ncbi:AcrR family transcriptional regulator [Nonomuraea thailandensis]|uniref:AcrR family transcriptional regulator n=1 Tax=Nonomuraea thailandensis TaxID=1188745 RepID=A0A9X2GI21_9ACTN|nr:TetR/AcrR family transcriptional regulator [Nonomuraea thailandensis]MCP2358055.1 AcrR family transcriptional regulator [Nonomuraea thailandensis]
MSVARPVNKGPRVAARNRAALIAAARDVFANVGYDAPLSLVARTAGVGQGSLYRHFPDRLSLALAVFDDGVAELEALAAEPGATLDDVLTLITEQIIATTAFIDMVDANTTDPRALAMRDRVGTVLAGKLAEAQQAGAARADLGSEDLLLAVSMLAGVLAKRPAPARRVAAARVWSLLRRGMHA